MCDLKNLLIALIVSIIGVNCFDDKDIESCMKSKHHKGRPGKEDSLHDQCKGWEQYSCCTKESTIGAHNEINHYNFNYNHCPGHKMSDKCREHFTQDLCFFDCDPYLKPWIVRVNRTFATERVFKVPICADECIPWWHDCKDDYTCTNNWALNFKWINGTNHCPANSQCRPFRDIYSEPKEFCEQVWDHSWKYTEDKPCMKMQFGRGGDNPNKQTAILYATKAFRATTSAADSTYATISILLFTTIQLFLF